jgi:hypothetical protein
VVTNTKMKAAALPEKYLNLFREAVDRRTSIQERS